MNKLVGKGFAIFFFFFFRKHFMKYVSLGDELLSVIKVVQSQNRNYDWIFTFKVQKNETYLIKHTRRQVCSLVNKSKYLCPHVDFFVAENVVFILWRNIFIFFTKRPFMYFLVFPLRQMVRTSSTKKVAFFNLPHPWCNQLTTILIPS